MKPSLEDIQSHIDDITPRLQTKTADELGQVWILAKSLREKYQINSPEAKLLTTFDKSTLTLLRKRAIEEQPTTTLSPAEQERQENATKDRYNGLQRT